MIELTPVAAEQLRTLRGADPRHQILRVYVAGQSCCGYRYGLAFDEAAQAEDTVTEEAGIPVAVDAESLPFVQGSVVDFVDSPAGRGFTVRNPEVAQGGGCTCGGR
ncbi:MAG TPA: iron-sulfur cluster assembly accessory protein [Candidatus Limnocylindria bacterium]